MPDLNKKYPSYADFAGKTVVDLFGKDKIAKSIVKRAELFESCLFKNNGDGTFATEKLPTAAQFAPINAILSVDFNSDGNPDLVAAGNNYQIRPSLGRQDASYGWFLKGSKSYAFETLNPVQSGFNINGESRKMRSISIAGKPYIIVGVNHGDIQIFKVF